MPQPSIVSTVSPFWFTACELLFTRPALGRDSEARDSSITRRNVMVSPGRTGLSQRTLSMPGDPMLAERPMVYWTMQRMAMQQVCQPLAITAVESVLRRPGVGMERLRVELLCKRDDLFFAKRVAAKLDGFAHLEVFPVQHRDCSPESCGV